MAKIAASSGIGSKQIRQLLSRASTSSLDSLEAIVKYQISRRIAGFREFGEPLLTLIEQHRQDKPFIVSVLRHVCLTTDYYREEKYRKLEPEIESIVRRATSDYGYQRMEVSTERGLSLSVRLSNFRGNPRLLSDQIREQLVRNIPQLQETSLQVWIEMPRR